MLHWPIVTSLITESSLWLKFKLLQISLIGNLGNQVSRKEDVNKLWVLAVSTISTLEERLSLLQQF